ncbi:hypothetical protein VTK73DRAFT_9239 [Phialemonium thermophilum]|uniref:Uncharacterized protein n=1 Tax=Phialemonium thermophilum TaxID=223376 RepID=A0ABR3W3I4_9PEZI
MESPGEGNVHWLLRLYFYCFLPFACHHHICNITHKERTRTALISESTPADLDSTTREKQETDVAGWCGESEGRAAGRGLCFLDRGSWTGGTRRRIRNPFLISHTPPSREKELREHEGGTYPRTGIIFLFCPLVFFPLPFSFPSWTPRCNTDIVNLDYSITPYRRMLS